MIEGLLYYENQLNAVGDGDVTKLSFSSSYM